MNFLLRPNSTSQHLPTWRISLLTSAPNGPAFHGPHGWHVGRYTPDRFNPAHMLPAPALRFYSAMTFTPSYATCASNTHPSSVSWREGRAGNSSLPPASEELGSERGSGVLRARRKWENVILRPGLRSHTLLCPVKSYPPVCIGWGACSSLDTDETVVGTSLSWNLFSIRVYKETYDLPICSSPHLSFFKEPAWLTKNPCKRTPMRRD